MRPERVWQVGDSFGDESVLETAPARSRRGRDDTKDFSDVIRKDQRLLDLLSVIIARANADIIRNLPARGRYAPSSPSEPPSASSSPQYEVDDDDDDRKENYSPQWEASSPGYD